MNAIAKKTSSKESPTVFWMPPLSSEISGNLSLMDTQNNIVDLQTFLRVVSPVSHSPRPASREEKTTPGICGLPPSSAFAWFDPATDSLRMSQDSLPLGILIESWPTWPRAGTMQNGLVWEQMTSERITKESDYGYWPTPTKCGNYNRKGASKNSGDGLATKVKMFRIETPTAGTGTKGRSAKWRKGKTPNPQEFVQSWPTPASRDYRNQHAENSTAFENRKNHARGVNLVEELQRHGDGGKLNPDWVEWLMGWPIGWTDLKPLETDKFRSAWLTPFQSYLKELLTK